MKSITKIGLYGLSTGVAIFIAGCQTPPIEADYVLPARKVADVSKVDVVTIKVDANINGNMAGNKAMNEALVRQMLSARLYKSGYYQVMDDLWGASDGPEKMSAILANAVDAGHGFESYTVGETIPDSERCPNCGQPCAKCKGLHKGSKAKAELAVKIDLALDTNEVIEEKTFQLEKTPYAPVKVKDGMPPTSAPNVVGITKETKTIPTKVFKTVAKGTVKVQFNGIDGEKSPVTYENTFTLPIVKVEPKVENVKPKSALGGFADAAKAGLDAALGKKPDEDLGNLASPSQLEALAEVLSPAIAEIVADISPYTETRKLVPIEGGDERVVTLLNAKAFREAVEFVTELVRSGKAVVADVENMGIALEAMGKFELAKKAYKKASKMNTEKPSETAKAGLARMEKILSGNAAIKSSGAKKNAGTEFKASK